MGLYWKLAWFGVLVMSLSFNWTTFLEVRHGVRAPPSTMGYLSVVTL